MLQANALVSLAELNAFIPTSGTVPADVRERREQAINDASGIIEGYCGRRLVYRAPPDTAATGTIVAAVTLVNTTPLTIANQPTAPGRTLIVTTVDADHSLTAGILTVTGTVAGVTSQTEVFDLTLGPVLHGTKFFTAIASLIPTGCAGNGAGDTIRVTSSEGYIEYHSPSGMGEPWAYGYGWRGYGYSDLWALDRPFRQVLEVNEDSSQVYGAGTLLTVGTDYRVSAPMARIVRVSGFWSLGVRSVRTIYSAGYFTSANVPSDIKKIARTLAASLDQEATARRWGQSSQGDAVGNWQRFAVAGLTDDMKDTLRSGGHRRKDLHTTAERDFDLEAAS